MDANSRPIAFSIPGVEQNIQSQSPATFGVFFDRGRLTRSFNLAVVRRQSAYRNAIGSPIPRIRSPIASSCDLHRGHPGWPGHLLCIGLHNPSQGPLGPSQGPLGPSQPATMTALTDDMRAWLLGE